MGAGYSPRVNLCPRVTFLGTEPWEKQRDNVLHVLFIVCFVVFLAPSDAVDALQICIFWTFPQNESLGGSCWYCELIFGGK